MGWEGRKRLRPHWPLLVCHVTSIDLTWQLPPDLDQLTVWKAPEETRNPNSETESENVWPLHVWPTFTFSLAAAYLLLRNTPAKRTRSSEHRQNKRCAERSFVHLRTSWLPSSDWTAGCDPPPKETQSLNWTDLWVTLTAGQETLLFTLLLIEMGKIQHVAPSVVINLYWRGQTPPPLPLIFKYGQNVPPIQRWSPAPSGGAPGPYFSKNLHRMNASWRSDRNLAWIKWSLSTHSRFPLFNTYFYNIYGGKVPPLPVPPCDLISVNKLPPSKKVISKYYLLL